MKPKKAFTLIEILVVVSIIALLAAILFPVFARARENARRASCQSNLKQIGIGLLQYLQDYDETMPRSFFGANFGDSDATTKYKWMDAISPYTKSEQIFDCPSDALSPKYQFRSGQNYGSYGQNGAYSASGDSQTPPRSSGLYLVRVSQIAASSTTIWATDTNNSSDLSSGGSSNGSYGFLWPNAAANPTIETFNGVRQLVAMRERHLETVNVLFCDGHVKALKLDALAKTKTLVDPLNGQTKNVMTAFTIEDD